MRRIIIALAAGFATSAFALSFQSGDLKVEFRSDPCQEVVPLMLLSTVTDAAPSRADISYQGQAIAGCWVEKDGRIYIADENGAGGYIEKSELQ
jgi:hypothetical protein